jgi:hypothetical protein
MSTSYRNRILDRMFIGASTFAGTLASVSDSTPNVSMLGCPCYVTDGTYILSYRYVKTASSNLGTILANCPVYFTDAQMKTVNSDPAYALTYVASTDSAIESAAGFVLASSITAGYGCWIQTGGYLASIVAPSLSNLGDRLVLSNSAGSAPSTNTLVRVARGTAPTPTEAMHQLYVVPHTSVAAGVVNGWIKGNAALP